MWQVENFPFDVGHLDRFLNQPMVNAVSGLTVDSPGKKDLNELSVKYIYIIKLDS